MLYVVGVRQIYEGKTEVEAESYEEAQEIVRKKLEDGSYEPELKQQVINSHIKYER